MVVEAVKQTLEQALGLVPDQIIDALELIPWWVVLLFKIYVGFNGAMFALRWFLKVDTSLHISDAEKKKNRVIIIGAGFNGIGMGCLCKMAGLDFIIIDRAQGVGGTWWYNRFPGAQVDVFSHTYSYTFLNYFGWTNNYSYTYEILGYIRYAVLYFGIEKHLILNTVFKGANWSEKTSTWTVKTDNSSFEGKFLINCMGFLYKPNVPKFKGQENFKGRVFHSARWEQDYDWRGKKVGVIGAGATAIQAVPEMAKTAKVTMFQRTPCSVVPKLGDVPIGPAWRFLWRWCPGFYLLQKIGCKLYLESFRYSFGVGTTMNKMAEKWIQGEMEKQLSDRPDLLEKFQFPRPLTLCKRIPIYHEFYRIFKERNCTLETDGIDCFTEKGIKTKTGTEHEFDLVVLCTGFNMFHYQDSEIVGRDGYSVRKDWDEGVPYAHLGCQLPKLPNYFMILGPQSGQVHGAGSVYYGEFQCELAFRSIKHVLENGYQSFELKKGLLEKHIKEYKDELNGFSKGLKSCTSWYNKNGEVWQPWIFPSWKLFSACKWTNLTDLYNFSK